MDGRRRSTSEYSSSGSQGAPAPAPRPRPRRTSVPGPSHGVDPSVGTGTSTSTSTISQQHLGATAPAQHGTFASSASVSASTSTSTSASGVGSSASGTCSGSGSGSGSGSAPASVPSLWVANGHTPDIRTAFQFATTLDSFSGDWQLDYAKQHVHAQAQGNGSSAQPFSPHILHPPLAGGRTGNGSAEGAKGKGRMDRDRGTEMEMGMGIPMSMSMPMNLPMHGSMAMVTASASSSAAGLETETAGQSLLMMDERDDSADVDLDLDLDDNTGESSAKKQKIQRRQGVTCDQCRSKHLRCDLAERKANAEAAHAGAGAKDGSPSVRCSRCQEKKLECTKNHAPPSRRYPRPSRTGKRIEQARQFHGTAKPKAAAPIAEPVRLPLTYPGLGTTRHLDRRLSERVMAGAVSLQLLTCFFGTAHIQLPVVDFPNFSERYNAANGDPRIMAIMANGGDPEQGIASAIPPAPGLSTATWPDTKRSRISTPGTVETLVAAMHAWAAHYCDMPIAFGSEAAAFGFPASAQTSGMLGLGMPHEMRLGGPDGQRPVTSEAESGPGRGPWRAERAKEMLKWGRARRAFCQGMLDKALALVDRHGLMRKPSLEAVQTLMLLAQLLEHLDRQQSKLMISAAFEHVEVLQLQANFEVDERDKAAVEKLLSQMQKSRVYLSAWTRDAVASGMYRQVALFHEERAVEVSGGRKVPVSEDGSGSSVVSGSGRDAQVELSGEMGLTFSIMALMQVGSLSRFVARHIDCVEGMSASHGGPDPAHRFSGRISAGETKKLTKACNAVWRGIDALMLFFDRCALKARESMDRLQPFQPLGWIATIKICGAVLDLAVYRVLGERNQINMAYLTALTLQRGPEARSADDLAQARALRDLFERSRERTLVSCRRMAKLVEFLLPRRVFQTGGVMLRQLLPVAQFLARTLTIESAAPWLRRAAAARGTGTRMDPPADTLQESGGHVPPRTGSDSAASLLSTWDRAAKEREVGWCIQGLAQLGFAWDRMDREVEGVEKILEESLRAQEQAQAQGYA